MTISIITAVFNREETIEQSVRSVQLQNDVDVEHVVIDGASHDDTLSKLKLLLKPGSLLISEKDSGIYDALNKGILACSGEIIGFMHSDDYYASDDVLAAVHSAFEDPSVDAVYGDLIYVSANDIKKVIRTWKSCDFTPQLLRKGWMPPHPTLFVRRRIIEKLGPFDTSYRIAADYDSILRYFGSTPFKSVYIPKVFVHMRTGGESNRNIRRIIRKSTEDLRALRKYNIGGVSTLLRKNLSKIGQFW